MRTLYILLILHLLTLTASAQQTLITKDVKADELKGTMAFRLFASKHFSIVKYSDGAVRSMVTTDNPFDTFSSSTIMIGFYNKNNKLIKKIEWDGLAGYDTFNLCEDSNSNYHHEQHDILKKPCDCTPYILTDLYTDLTTHIGYIRIVATTESKTIDEKFWTPKTRNPIKK